MINFEIFYNRVHKNSCNLVKEIIRGHYVAIDKTDNNLLIDNIKIASLDEINSIRFLINGYYQQINISTNMPIYSINK